MKKATSLVWRFFDRIEERGRTMAVSCKLCDSQYKYFGNTTNLKSHLVRKHPIQWELLTTGNLEGSTRRIKSHDMQLQSDNETENNEDHAATIHLVRDMNPKESEEEWLEEDPFSTSHIESFEPKKKKMKVLRIKRETESPPLRHSTYQRSPKKYEYDNSTPLIIDASQSQLKDEYSVFGEYVANKLRKFKTPRTRGNLQQLITTILWQAEYGMYDDAESVRKVLVVPTQTTVEQQEIHVSQIEVEHLDKSHSTETYE